MSRACRVAVRIVRRGDVWHVIGRETRVEYADRLRARALPGRCTDLFVDGTPVRVMHAGPMSTGPEHWAPIARAILAARGAWRQ